MIVRGTPGEVAQTEYIWNFSITDLSFKFDISAPFSCFCCDYFIEVVCAVMYRLDNDV